MNPNYFLCCICLLLSFSTRAQIQIPSGTLASAISNAGEGDYYITEFNALYIGMFDGRLEPMITALGATDGEILSWNNTTKSWQAVPVNLGALTVTTQTIHQVNRARVVLTANNNINTTSIHNVGVTSFQLNQTNASLVGPNIITGLSGDLCLIIQPNLISSGSERTNVNINFLINGSLHEKLFTPLYARNQIGHSDTGAALIFEYENALPADQFQFQLERQTTNTTALQLVGTSRLFIEEYNDVLVVNNVTAPIDLNIAQGPTGAIGATGSTGPQGIPGAAISSPLDVYHATGNIKADGVFNYIQGATVVRNSLGNYTVTFDSPHLSGPIYPVLFSMEQNIGADDYVPTYTIINDSSFRVEIGEQDNGSTGGIPRDAGFSFYVPL